MKKILILVIPCIFFCTCQRFKEKMKSKNDIPKCQISRQQPSEKNTIVLDHKQFTEDQNIVINNEFLEILKSRMDNIYDCVTIKSNVQRETSIINDRGIELYKIASGTGITILAESYIDTYDNKTSIREYIVLIKIDNKDELWSGWIKQDSLDITTSNIVKKRDVAPFLPDRMSPDNKKIALTNYKNHNEVEIIDNMGNVISNITDKQFSGIEEWPTRVIGWSDNSQNVQMMKGDCCIYIQLIDGNYHFFNLPDIIYADNLDITPVIDFNTGDYYYTDYDPRVVRGRDTEEYWDEYYKQTFHLYKYNFFTDEKIEQETIYGRGFILSVKNNKKSITTNEK